MPQVIVHAEHPPALTLDTDPQIELFQDQYPKQPKAPGTIRVLYLCEPPVIMRMHNKVRRRAHMFDYILTYDPWVLKRYSKAHKHVYGTCWVDSPPPEREFSISTVIGTKLISKGHRLRHKFWRASTKIRNPLRLFFSRQFEEDGIPTPPGSTMLGEDKSPVFRSRFHVAIENCRMPDYFTEKIMDCFMTEAVPIYWGCTNIKKYFNPDGMIICKTLGSLIRACNRVTPETYENMRGAMAENRERAEDYRHSDDRLAAKLQELVALHNQAKA